MKKIFMYFLLAAAFTIQAYGQIMWTKHSDYPVFPRGENGAWDSQLVLNPYVMYNGSIYQMWYSGYDGGNGGAKIGYAFSSDGINEWTRYDTPVFMGGPSGSWDGVTSFQPSVLIEGNTYKMWYCGHDGNLDHRQIGYATGSGPSNWTRYGSDPVLTPGPAGSWDDLYVESPEVQFIDGMYHMWYSGSNGTYSQIGHATSMDGITWEKDLLNPVLKVGDTGSWDEFTLAQPSVVFDGTIYRMWYGGGVQAGWDWKTGYAYSVDGINWVKVSVNNPVMGLGDPGNWDDKFVGLCSVIFDEAESTFKMWYGGGNANVVGDIGYVESGWAKSDSPVFTRGESGYWDSQFVSGPSIIYDGSIYHMYYSGYGGGNSGSKIGYAKSPDGINGWTRYYTPAFTGGPYGSWDGYSAFQPDVLDEDTVYKMWYCGHDGSLDHRQIGYATSNLDPFNWSRYGAPVLTPGPPGSWDDLYVESPEVKFIGGMYHMWYSGSNGTKSQIGHATSPDGITWEKDSLNPVLEAGNAGSWDELTVVQPSVVFDGNIYHMWYGGGVEFDWAWKIGYAYSVDGINWIKVSVNSPVMGLGEPGSWDDKFVGLCSVIFDEAESTFKMWYGGGNGNVVGDIGYASYDFVTVIENDNVNVVPAEFSLFQNYPNPFNPTTTINYQIPETGFVTLKIYDILGREITTLINERKVQGRYSVNFDASRLATGVYIYQLRVNDYVSSKKMILLK